MSSIQDPFERFQTVFDEAVATGMDDPNAMVVSSVDAVGQPSSRVVLLKDFDESGFVFFTNFESRKGREILARPRVSLNFYWREIAQQVRIQGEAERVRDQEADEYFETRPRISQLGAWASRQSRPLEDRAQLMERVERLDSEYRGRPVARPPHWSGFRVVPTTFEFWVAGEYRLHDRTVFERTDGGWTTHKLYP